MEKQGIITCYFPCPSARQIQEIHNEVLTTDKWFNPHFADATIKIRPYFGETLAFYFKFVAHLAQSMLVPGFVGVVFFVLNRTDVVDQENVGQARQACCVLFSIWAATLLQIFSRHSSRTKQFWGVEETERFAQPNPDWDPTRTGETARLCVNLATVTYIVVQLGSTAPNAEAFSRVGRLKGPPARNSICPSPFTPNTR